MIAKQFVCKSGIEIGQNKTVPIYGPSTGASLFSNIVRIIPWAGLDTVVGRMFDTPAVEVCM